jgi:hypothetical protein
MGGRQIAIRPFKVATGLLARNNLRLARDSGGIRTSQIAVGAPDHLVGGANGFCLKSKESDISSEA